MILENAYYLSQIIAVLAILASLIFVAMQIRQNTRIQQSAIAQATSASRTAWYDLVISNPDIGDIWRKGHAAPDLLTDKEQSRFIWMITRIFSNLEEFYLQFQHSMLSEEQWYVYRHLGQTMLENPVINDWWRSGTAIFDPGFVANLSPESKRAEWTANSMDELFTKKPKTSDA